MATEGVQQPIIRGIQAVGSVQLLYKYNSSDNKLPIPSAIKFGDGKVTEIATGTGIPAAGFRLDSEFVRANPQIASSFTIPILGGGGVSLTNNNRTGQLNLVCAKVSTPVPSQSYTVGEGAAAKEHKASTPVGSMYSPEGSAIGVYGGGEYYDMVTLAQIQQAQEAGDSVGATITLNFKFCGLLTTITFEGCTVATVDPIGLAGNDAVNYAIVFNYLNWVVEYSSSGAVYPVAQNSGGAGGGGKS